MESKVLNYRIIIEPEKNEKTGKVVYNAYAPTLGVADWGTSMEKALKNIKEAIECHIESLAKHNNPIPQPDLNEFMIATTKITLPKNIRLSFT